MQNDQLDQSFDALNENELMETNGGIGPLAIIGGIIAIAFLLGWFKGCSDEAQNHKK